MGDMASDVLPKTNALKQVGLNQKHGSGSCEHEVSSNESDSEIPSVESKQKSSGIQAPKIRSKHPPAKLPLTQDANKITQHHNHDNHHQEADISDVSPEDKQKVEQKLRTGAETSVTEPFKEQGWGKRRKKAHICGTKLSPDGDFTSDDCCSEISTTSTRASYLVDGLHSCCMAPVPDYDFTPNLARAREEITHRHRTSSVDSSKDIKFLSHNRRKQYSKNLREQQLNKLNNRCGSKQRPSIADSADLTGGFPRQVPSDVFTDTDMESQISEIDTRCTTPCGNIVSRRDTSCFRPKNEALGTSSSISRFKNAQRQKSNSISDVSKATSGASTPIFRATDDSSPTQIPGPVLLDDATWTKIEELVKTENFSAQKERKRTWFYGFLAGLVVAATVNMLASLLKL